MELFLGPEIINSYKRLSYTPWYALAEFVDNSTQAYFANKKILDKAYFDNSECLSVIIECGKDANGDFLRISDNSIGMSEEELKDAVVIGRPPTDTSGRSKYGLGMKTAACWFGDIWTINTKKLGADYEHFIEVNVSEVGKNNRDLNHKKTKRDKSEHYTIITIRKLHRKIYGRTSKKINDYLSSIYRIDFKKYNLKLSWQGVTLYWDAQAIEDRLIKNIKGEPEIKKFKFIIKDKKVSGWAGVFEKGSRRDAGFSIIQSDRVVIGWPDSYRPETLFGTQEGGSNDLVNQRLVGEIYLEDFDVSHTKDEILFSDDEKDRLENNLLKELKYLRSKALSYRKYASDERVVNEIDGDSALNEFEKEITSKEIKDFISTYEIPKINLIKEINEVIKKSVVKKMLKPSLHAKINNLNINVYLTKEISPNDPYLIIESTQMKNSVIVIINMSHPYWNQLKSQNSVLNYIRHCVYDGVAEWKTYEKVGKIEPDTVKLVKDNLLRIPLEIEKNQ